MPVPLYTRRPTRPCSLGKPEVTYASLHPPLDQGLEVPLLDPPHHSMVVSAPTVGPTSCISRPEPAQHTEHNRRTCKQQVALLAGLLVVCCVLRVVCLQLTRAPAPTLNTASDASSSGTKPWPGVMLEDAENFEDIKQLFRNEEIWEKQAQEGTKTCRECGADLVPTKPAPPDTSAASAATAHAGGPASPTGKALPGT